MQQDRSVRGEITLETRLATLQVHWPLGRWGVLSVCVIWLCDITDDRTLVILTDAGNRNKEKKKQEVSLIKKTVELCS